MKQSDYAYMIDVCMVRNFPYPLAKEIVDKTINDNKVNRHKTDILNLLYVNIDIFKHIQSKQEERQKAHKEMIQSIGNKVRLAKRSEYEIKCSMQIENWKKDRKQY